MAGEKTQVTHDEEARNLGDPDHAPELYRQDETILLDIGALKSEGTAAQLRVANDGHTVLVPQPSDDPSDPLNWTWMKKSSILFTISVAAFLADFQAGAGIPCILPQAQEWKISPNEANYPNNLNVLMVGVGGLFWIPFIYFWGRAPVLFWTTLAGTLFTLGCIQTSSFTTYYGLRAMQGFMLTAGQTIGLAFIQDMFFFHQHAQKIGIWTACFLVSPYCGPLFGNFIIAGTGDWRVVYWMIFGLGCFVLVLVILLIDEPWYRRDLPEVEQPPNGHRLSKLIGIWQAQHHNGYFLSVGTSCRRLTYILFKPIIIPIMIYYCLTFMWAVGINQTSSILFAIPVKEGGYGFSDRSLGFIFFTPVVAVSIGELFGHIFNDFLSQRYIRNHGGFFKPESRLVSNYIAAVFMIPGIILVGQALAKHLHWVAIVMGWGMYVFGCMIASVAVTAYALDSYPTGSGEVSGLINFSRIIGGFAVGYFQQSWGKSAGYDVSFGVQAALIAIGLIFLICINIFGVRMRKWGGSLEA